MLLCIFFFSFHDNDDRVSVSVWKTMQLLAVTKGTRSVQLQGADEHTRARTHTHTHTRARARARARTHLDPESGETGRLH